MKSILITMAGAAALAATAVQLTAQGVGGSAPPAALPEAQNQYRAAQKEYQNVQTEFRRVQAENQNVQTNLDQVRTNFRQVQADLQLAQATQTYPGASVGFSGGGFGGVSAFGGAISTSSSRDSVPPVVIQFSDSNPTNIAVLEEDLTVMTRLIDKAIENSVGADSPLYKSGIPMVVTSSSRSVRPLYVDGFGVLFMVKVNFPMLGMAKREERQEPKPEPAKTVWNEAREELFPTKQHRGTTAEEEQFNPAQVDALKNGLLTVLQHAANIRYLKADDFVSINVFGQPYTGRASVQSAKRSAPARAGVSVQSVSKEASVDAAAGLYQAYMISTSSSSSRGTVMTLRAKKSDIDAFAKGTLDLDAFKAKATVNTYSGNGYDVKSVNSWAKPNTSSGSLR